MPRFSAREGRWYGLPPQRGHTHPEIERDDREWHTELPGGITRVDYGAPIHRLPSEPQAKQVSGTPIRAKRPSKPPSASPASPVASAPSASAAARQRDHRAITREP